MLLAGGLEPLAFDRWLRLRQNGGNPAAASNIGKRPIVGAEPNPEDDLAAKRLIGLLGYVEQLVKLDENPATRLSQHKLADGSQFILHQHELAGLPGIAFDSNDDDGPIWLRMQRLQRTAPPQIAVECRLWIDISPDPFKLPPIHETQHMRYSKPRKTD
jgi:hypothetical protein